MSNTLTALAPTLFSTGRQEVANEPFGVVDAVNMDFDDKGVAKGDTVTVDVAPAARRPTSRLPPRPPPAPTRPLRALR
jgi:hypothetical protein